MRSWRVLCALAVAAVALSQQGSRLYPTAKVDAAGTEQARFASATQPDIDVTVYTTADDFDRVCNFYRRNGKESKILGSGARKLPTGQDLKNAFFILDDSPDLISARLWVRIQRPYIGEFGLARNGGNTNTIRDITAIVLTRKK